MTLQNVNAIENGSFGDEILSAYIDDELGPVQRNAIRAAIRQDKVLAERVASLRRAKEWMRIGFGSARPPRRDK